MTGRGAPGRPATLVAFSGSAKSPELHALVEHLQTAVREAVEGFRPRPIGDVHATLVALPELGEFAEEAGAPALLDRLRPGDLAGLAGHLCTCLTRRPVELQFGGFADRDHSLASRGKRLYLRSLVQSGNQIVLIGWPVDAAGDPDARLDELRRAAATFGFAHRHHPTPDAVDPDAYMVIGEVDATADPATIGRVLDEQRRWLRRNRIRVGLSPQSLTVAVYVDNRLPAGSTVSTPLAELVRCL